MPDKAYEEAHEVAARLWHDQLRRQMDYYGWVTPEQLARIQQATQEQFADIHQRHVVPIPAEQAAIVEAVRKRGG